MSTIFSDFTFAPLISANPPKEKGVYIIRVKNKGESIERIIENIQVLSQRLCWPIVSDMVDNRINRILKINECPIIYIVSASTRKSSNHTLNDRYRDFAGHHTAMFPLWALVYFGWTLEYGWKTDNKPRQFEEALKTDYRNLHEGKLPALVYQ